MGLVFVQPIHFASSRNLHENELKNMSRQNFRLNGLCIGQQGVAAILLAGQIIKVCDSWIFLEFVFVIGQLCIKLCH